MVGHGHGNRGAFQPLLHHDVVTTLASRIEALPGQDVAHLAPGEDAQPSHAPYAAATLTLVT